MHNPNDPQLKSWVPVAPESDFPIQNLPFGVFAKGQQSPRVGVAIGERVLDLAVLFQQGFFKEELPGEDKNIFATSSLNAFLEKGKTCWTQVREKVSKLLREDNEELKSNQQLCEVALLWQREVHMLLPVEVKNFIDFYSNKEHASNVGSMFRDPNNPLLPNWKHLPVGYNGRASSVVVSGTDIFRPCGQTKADDAASPQFTPSRLLDMELEVGTVIGTGNALGDRVSTSQASDHVFGLVLLNDWSARDIQKWEYVPLGPFLGKSFATTISPWVVTMDALEPFRVAGPEQDPPVLPHLQFAGKGNYDIILEAYLQSENMPQPERVTHTNFATMYWNIAQQIAHLTSNGTNMQPGDIYGSGTVSGATDDSLGSFLELCWKGTRPLKFSSGEERKFIQDNDTVTLRGWCQGQNYRVGFGECSGRILKAKV